MSDLSAVTMAAREREREEKAAARTKELEPFMLKFSSMLKHCWDKMELGVKDADLHKAANQGSTDFLCATMPSKLTTPKTYGEEGKLISKQMEPLSSSVSTIHTYYGFRACIQSKQDPKNQLCFTMPDSVYNNFDPKFIISWANN